MVEKYPRSLLKFYGKLENYSSPHGVRENNVRLGFHGTGAPASTVGSDVRIHAVNK